MVRPLRLMVLAGIAVGCVACGRMQARALPPVVMDVPPPPPRVAIPVSLPEQPVVEPDPEPPSAPPAAPARRPENAPPRTVVERPAPPAAPATPEGPAPALHTTPNVSALAQRATWLLGQAEKDLERVNVGQLVPQERAQYDRAQGFIRNARNALQRNNFTFAEQLADKALKLARALIKT